MSNFGPYQYSELRACALREYRLRTRVYPTWIDAGKITKRLAEEEISKMFAISEHFAELMAKEKLL